MSLQGLGHKMDKMIFMTIIGLNFALIVTMIIMTVSIIMITHKKIDCAKKQIKEIQRKISSNEEIKKRKE